MADKNDLYTFYEDDANLAIAGPAVVPPRRGRLSAHLPIRFSPDVLDAARRFAIEDGQSISSWVRLVVEREVMRRTSTRTVSRIDYKFEVTVAPPAGSYTEAPDLIDA